ncbi:MAG: Holliday junction branch migration DNA helicase RuvB [Candidatus Wildermuthbacteria bacterium]|nr:Holliday junction branch migration DNA helicase RuvB [Candidatus Wildermuthbacteria bacterium]
MVVNKPHTSSKEEREWDASLRPGTWQDYIGQEKIKNNLRIIIDSAKKRSEPLEHLLFYGNSGLGKTTLAHVIANEVGVRMKICSGPTIEKSGELASLLTNLEEGDILFIDECHRVHKSAMEALYSAMEDFKLHILIGKGPMARTMELSLPRFTLVGATTRLALLPTPLRNRFGAIFQFSFYETDDMEKIIKRAANILNIEIDGETIRTIASRSRFTPRIANRILKRVRDFAISKDSSFITPDIGQQALEFFEIDQHGLEPGDRKILETIITKFSGGPVGIQALAAATSEEQDAILDIYEPYLLRLGFIERTPRGRVATRLAYQHLGMPTLRKELI